MQFDKKQFQDDLRAHIPAMVNSDIVINDGQLTNYLEFFASSQDKYSQQECEDFLSVDEKRKAIRLVFVYYTLALSLKDDLIFGAALEIFPLNLIGSDQVTLVLDITDHLIKNPSKAQEYHLSDSSIDINNRLDKLKIILNSTFANSL